MSSFISPVIRMLDGETIRNFDRSVALAPEGFVPVLTLNKSER